MCVASKPKIPDNPAEDNKPLPIIRNPILDGLLGNVGATRSGRNALRIDLINPLTIPTPGEGGVIAGGVGSGGGVASGGGVSSGGGVQSPRERSRTGNFL